MYKLPLVILDEIWQNLLINDDGRLIFPGKHIKSADVVELVKPASRSKKPNHFCSIKDWGGFLIDPLKEP